MFIKLRDKQMAQLIESWRTLCGLRHNDHHLGCSNFLWNRWIHFKRFHFIKLKSFVCETAENGFRLWKNEILIQQMLVASALYRRSILNWMKWELYQLNEEGKTIMNAKSVHREERESINYMQYIYCPWYLHKYIRSVVTA